MEISRFRDVDDIANVGLSLAEGKLLLLVAAQARSALLRPECPSAAEDATSKTGRRHLATLFGAVAVRLPRFRCVRCGHNANAVSWPSHCRSTPELDQLRAHLSALMPFRVAADVLSIFCRWRLE